MCVLCMYICVHNNIWGNYELHVNKYRIYTYSLDVVCAVPSWLVEALALYSYNDKSFP